MLLTVAVSLLLLTVSARLKGRQLLEKHGSKCKVTCFGTGLSCQKVLFNGGRDENMCLFKYLSLPAKSACVKDQECQSGMGCYEGVRCAFWDGGSVDPQLQYAQKQKESSDDGSAWNGGRARGEGRGSQYAVKHRRHK